MRPSGGARAPFPRGAASAGRTVDAGVLKWTVRHAARLKTTKKANLTARLLLEFVAEWTEIGRAHV